MTIELDSMNEVESWKGGWGTPIPVGDHVTKIIDSAESTTSTHLPQLEVQWEVAEGAATGTSSREYIVITERSKGKVKAFLEALGYPIPEGKFHLNADELRGRRAYTCWREEPYNGTVRVKCQAHSPVPAATGGFPPDIPVQAEPVGADLDIPF